MHPAQLGVGCDDQPDVDGVIEVVVHEHDVAAGTGEQARSDARAQPRLTVDPQLTGGNVVEVLEQLMQRHVVRPLDVPVAPLARLTHVDHDGVRFRRPAPGEVGYIG